MSVRGVWQLQQLVLQYSETGDSSRGLRFYMRHLLHKWKERNPQVEVRTRHSKYQEPKVVVYYANGRIYSSCLKILKPRQIENMLNFYRNSETGNELLRHGGPKVWTERRSIQGMWAPSLLGMQKTVRNMFKGKMQNLPIPKYSHASLRLGRQANLGEGRWGMSREYPKGFDIQFLTDIFKQPYDPSLSHLIKKDKAFTPKTGQRSQYDTPGHSRASKIRKRPKIGAKSQATPPAVKIIGRRKKEGAKKVAEAVAEF
eukprot:Platyproteum_vivax@DN1141_c0_g1_i1.p1